MRKHRYSEGIYGGLRLESVTPTALFPVNHMLTQGSLRYRLPTPGNHSQGDSTLYALRLLGENIVFASSCVSILGPTP
ncbi:hypothetical protein KZY75_09595 [Prevotella salivae]|uniref:Uncharacterized protein n=1 Tax=Segatella salivae TaxID=228604 RepID=A0AAW4NTD3_9BACT|nr:hypothetical protein [Segatella salivae]MBW4866401.1 hypothetical protein [Segatella salivae]MBW4910267.1 hypothetical protein [Segatella salivae]